MNGEELYEVISALSKEAGFVDFGAAPVEKLTTERLHLEEYIAEGHSAGMGYMAGNMSLREDPGLLLDGAKSVLCFLAPYKPLVLQDESLPRIASYAYGMDYHRVIKDKLFKIIKEIKTLIPEATARAFTDSAPVFERAWAAKAGLGFIGKSTFLISRRYGLHTLIGVIILDREVKYGKMVPAGCGKCTKCLDSCPTGALCRPFRVDARKCISYQTIESKKEYAQEEFIIDLKNSIFGCDICMNACPWSAKGNPGLWQEFMPLSLAGYSKTLPELNAGEWMAMEEDTFKEYFSESPLSRPGLQKIKSGLVEKKISDEVANKSRNRNITI
ncbi:MAG: tRNA epoxyqueuosine(34) reductase QueG [Bacteroidales bacterium]|nr:tRNA epoxyqueuosine(34) reductase QueG [Bacteroidales bacterium]